MKRVRVDRKLESKIHQENRIERVRLDNNRGNKIRQESRARVNGARCVMR
jgi:hypothetical protein